ncbi:putative ribonuclease H-like domain-containing protein [Tanacetum coccineum]|uniref:Ribonuclease H-like domain-containing protein n=1 Tax=Tanacetum coccineum TaxID=301880 RepID=A0ABQ5GCR4_9ASTR
MERCSLFDYSLKNASNDEPQPSSDAGKKDDEVVCKESGIADQEKSKNNTQGVNTARPSINTGPDMFSLGDNATTTHANFFGDETEVDMEQTLLPHIPSSVLTRKMTKTTNEQGFISAVYKGKTHEDLHTCLFACFLSQVEPKMVTQALTDPSWIEAMNKKDERDIVVRNKARLVVQGYTQEEGIDYDEVFAQVARIEAIRLFLAYASFMNFVVYQMDTASTPIETSKPLLKDAEAKDVDVHLYTSMIGSLMYLTSSRPDIMFVVCACARFQVTPKVSHIHVVKRISRYLKSQPKLGIWYPKDSPFDLEGYTDSDYAGVSLDRKFTTRGYQFLGSRLISWECKKQTIVANSTTKAEYVVAANCYGQVLWIQNQMLDYGYNFMNTKIFIHNENIICIVKNPVFHSKTKHIEIRHHFIRDSNEKKLIQMIKIYTYQNVADLLTKAFDVGRFQYLINGKAANDGIQVNDVGLTYYWQETKVPQPNSPPDTNVTDEAASTGVDVRHGGAATTVTSLDAGHGKLMVLCTQLSKKVESLEPDLKQTKNVSGAAYTKLIKKVKRLESATKSSQDRRRARIFVSDDKEDLEDPSKQGRKIAQIDEDKGITLVQMGAQTQGRLG